MSTKELQRKQVNRLRRANRTRARLHGTAVKPRLSVFVSLRNVAAQLIDDDASKTLVAVSTLKQKDLKGKTMTEKAAWVGEQIAVQAKSQKVEAVVFDRGAKQYHGRVAALADAAREKGLKV